MNNIFQVIVLVLFTSFLFGQEDISTQQVKKYFKEVKQATKKKKNLWGVDLYGPLLLVDTKTRQVYANVQDSVGELKEIDHIFTGTLPKNQLIANTATKWNGTHWAMIMLPLSENKHDYINLMSHELFHVVQKDLVSVSYNTESIHLNDKEGRIYLRLELEALKKAVLSNTQTDVDEHLTNALVFRKYRHSLYEGSDVIENKLELNEGLAEYTGQATSNRNNTTSREHFISSVDEFYKDPSFVRSFAYQTTPIYGYLLDKRQPGWNRELRKDDNLTEMFIEKFNLKIPKNTEKSVVEITKEYNGQLIIKEEQEREKRILKLVAEYKKVFIDQPHFEVKLEKMRIQFTPSNLQPLEDKGTVYPNMNVFDNWGSLSVTKGALMSKDWKTIFLGYPTKIEEGKLTGEGWILEFSEKYQVEKNNQGNYILIKKR